jgi:sialic acid synthase SpsE
MKINIDGKDVGDGCPCYCIAEIGSNFDGSMERAKKLIDLAKESGADAVKFQSFKADKIVSEKGFDGLKAGFQANWQKPVVEVYKDAEFPREWTKELMEYSKSKGITFFSSPYDKEAVDILDELGVAVFKIGSGDITWLEMIRYIASKGKPVILGTGASTIEEIEKAVKAIKSTGNNDIILLQCVTNYPASYESANIRAMPILREKFDSLVGYSDHTLGYVVPMGAVALGACVIEKHFTDDNTRKGPDHPHAMEGKDFKQMVDNIRLLEKALGKPVKTLYPEESETIVLQRRCIRAKQDIKKGSKIEEGMLDILRPAPKNTLYPEEKEKLIGMKAKKDIKKGEEFYWEMVEE